MKPQRGSEGYEKWLKMNSFFHRSIVPTYSELSGLGEDEAKKDLQVRFACVYEYEDHYNVESVGSMSISRLLKFNEDCQQFLAVNYGQRADELLTLNMNKLKRIEK
jgi:hypothetical protein